MAKMARLIHRNLGDALTVERLIEDLQTMPPQALVAFTCDYGDHCHTQQVLPVEQATDLTEIGTLYESGYSNSSLALRENEGDKDEDEKTDEGEEEQEELPAVVILSAARY